jgi:hypothetical protein
MDDSISNFDNTGSKLAILTQKEILIISQNFL